MQSVVSCARPNLETLESVRFEATADQRKTEVKWVAGKGKLSAAVCFNIYSSASSYQALMTHRFLTLRTFWSEAHSNLKYFIMM